MRVYKDTHREVSAELSECSRDSKAAGAQEQRGGSEGGEVSVDGTRAAAQPRRDPGKHKTLANWKISGCPRPCPLEELREGSGAAAVMCP